MAKESEQLLETLLNLERARSREYSLRTESEALIEGLRGINTAGDTGSLFRALIDTLRTVLDFQDGFILQSRADGDLVPIASTNPLFTVAPWKPHSLFRRVLAGITVAVFDVEVVPEWSVLPAAAKVNTRSALLIPLNDGRRGAILACTHPEPRHFGPAHVKQAGRFAPFASQALQTLDLQQVLTQRNRFFDLSLDLMGIVGFDHRFRQFNNAWGELLGYEETQLQDALLPDLLHAEDREPLAEDLLSLQKKGRQLLREYRFRCHDGTYRWLSCSLAAYAGEQLYYLVARDVNDRVVAEQRLIKDSMHDPLTGIFNRTVLLERLQGAISQAARNSHFQFAVLFLDIDRFKVINDSLGHSAGDELLKEVSLRILEVVREVDTAARIGGDEFVVLLSDIATPSGAILVAERLQQRLGEPISLGRTEVNIGASIGITVSSLGYQSAEDVLRDADIAMYDAKTKGRSRYSLFDGAMHVTALKRLRIENDLRRAIERKELSLHYQPILCIETGAINSFEALLRWHHPTMGTISPDEFIPIAEESGLIIPLGQWVLEETCRHLSVWRFKYPRHRSLCVNINISVRQFWEKGFLEKISETLRRFGLDNAAIGLEITESAILYDAEEAIDLFRTLKEAGFRVYIDDFGKGYSSLSYLHRFPFDGLKIDRSFISRMEEDATSRELVRTILLLAWNLSLNVVAEGIENKEEFESLLAMGCSEGQGFLFSRPIPEQEAGKLLEKGKMFSSLDRQEGESPVALRAGGTPARR
jgi:diguanylate cyclase (GGDEF)-like protein/PAS domain S-box-containing protein